MAGASLKKRSFSGDPKGKSQRPTKKQRQAAAYHSSSEDEESDSDEGAALPADLLDSEEEDFGSLEADDGASTGASGSDPDSEDDSAPKPKSTPSRKSKPELKQKKFVAKDAPGSGDSADEQEDDDGEEGSEDDDEADSHDSSDDGLRGGANRAKSKRNDPDAFATSMSKMLSSKLPASKRADPIVARSAAASANSKQLVDSVLEAKARKRLREQKRLAMEKGRVRDVLVPSTTRTLNIATGEIEEVVVDGAETTGQILVTERRLKKSAQRGVVKLFNAVRAAQVKAIEAERAAREEGIVGSKRKEEKITEMSRKGFLDLIANGGGGLKKGGLEEA